MPAVACCPLGAALCQTRPTSRTGRTDLGVPRLQTAPLRLAVNNDYAAICFERYSGVFRHGCEAVAAERAVRNGLDARCGALSVGCAADCDYWECYEY